MLPGTRLINADLIAQLSPSRQLEFGVICAEKAIELLPPDLKSRRDIYDPLEQVIRLVRQPPQSKADAGLDDAIRDAEGVRLSLQTIPTEPAERYQGARGGDDKQQVASIISIVVGVGELAKACSPAAVARLYDATCGLCGSPRGSLETAFHGLEWPAEGPPKA